MLSAAATIGRAPFRWTVEALGPFGDAIEVGEDPLLDLRRHRDPIPTPADVIVSLSLLAFLPHLPALRGQTDPHLAAAAFAGCNQAQYRESADIEDIARIQLADLPADAVDVVEAVVQLCH